jgi:general secretion pathway protein G
MLEHAHQRRELGFTLIELMVVVAIIALLAAIVIPNYVHARAQAAVSQSEANMKQIATALELFYGDNETYPPSGEVAPALFGGATNPYLTTTPTNALQRQPYAYTNVAVAGKPDSYSILDSGPYDASTLSGLSKGAGTGALCGTTGCTQIVYDPQAGFYGQ